MVGAVEPITGIPRSLLDLFSCIGLGATEEDFWRWPGEVGTFVQSHTWEAYRYSGILVMRSYSRVDSQTLIASNDEDVSSHADAIAVNRILSSIDAVYGAKACGVASDEAIPHNIAYPLFVAGSQSRVIVQHVAWKETIRSKFQDLIQSDRYWQTEKIFDLLQDAWESWDAGQISDPFEMAAERGLELGLL
ncbi:uncharacterized protein N7496_007569 [Penicillium cataractarum]|uniref:Uncharacterized protein n=1 Tax=Penicillium cataractarum TaxID=2100454 RepID=A0A9W9S4F9_9EURO|nr:uncharacterized protein N7496_007569 [Penicillium cataractarum]KAJ5371477.1 hypothetical protein N7496_007569 [Penicillium cataractarum]